MIKKPLKVLYVEDDDSDVDLLKTALKHVDGQSLVLKIAEDGEKALDYLTGLHSKSSEIPDLILLDLNIPKIHGRDVLKMVKENERCKRIPVIVLSTSNLKRDIDESYELGACAYLVKPADFSQYKRIAKSLIEFWHDNVEFHSKTSSN